MAFSCGESYKTALDVSASERLRAHHSFALCCNAR
jgi:hypothetical protein